MKKIYFSFLIFFTYLNSNIGTQGFKDFANYYFVETGAYHGDGIFKALQANCFNELYSIEFDKVYFRVCTHRFARNGKVKIIDGDSQEKLWDVIKGLDKPITFWLDAHIYPPIYDGSDDKKNCPLIKELEQIKKHKIKTHTILIDDMACCGTLAFDYLTKKDLIKKIKEINPNYNIRFIVGGNGDEAIDNILVAKVNS